MTSGGNNFNDFPANQLNKFRANTANAAKLIGVQTESTCSKAYANYSGQETITSDHSDVPLGVSLILLSI